MNPKDLQRFWSKVEKTNNCWEWKAGKAYHGYGEFGVNGKIVLVHRFSYELFKGEIPKGLQIDHLCRNRVCVNPEHLEVVTNKENVLRGFGISAVNARKTCCSKGHELQEPNLYQSALRLGWRSCKICNRKRGREYYEKRKQRLIKV